MTTDLADNLRELTIDQLAAMRLALRVVDAGVKVDLAAIQDEITRRFSNLGSLALDEQGKTYGTVTRELIGFDGRYKIKAEVKQTVKWDSEALQTLAADLTWKQIQHWFKIAFSVPEAKFKAMEPGPFKEKLEQARTTKLSPLAITLIDPDA